MERQEKSSCKICVHLGLKLFSDWTAQHRRDAPVERVMVCQVDVASGLVYTARLMWVDLANVIT